MVRDFATVETEVRSTVPGLKSQVITIIDTCTLTGILHQLEDIVLFSVSSQTRRAGVPFVSVSHLVRILVPVRIGER